MNNHKICFLNSGSIHYRKAIWMLMDKELSCDFYFGDHRRDDVKPLDTSLLRNFKGYFKNIYIGPFFWQRGALKLLWKDYSDYILQGDVYSLTVWLFLLLKRINQKNVYLWTHGAYGNEKGLKKFIRKKCVSLSTGTFLYGRHAKDVLQNWGIPGEKLHLIYNSLDYDEQLPVRQSMFESDFYKQHFKNNNQNLVFIGRLTPVKKLDQVLKAVAHLKEQGVIYNVTFVGDGTEKNKLEDMSNHLGLSENVWYYGSCYDEKRIAEFLYNADVCVSPGNVGLTAMHAMTFGCPVISNDNFNKQMPEYEAIEDGVTGAFFHEDDIISFADSIKRWLDSSKDRDAIREACYRVIDEKYNPHVQVQTLRLIILGTN